jgi:hypothetical protein
VRELVAQRLLGMAAGYEDLKMIIIFCGSIRSLPWLLVKRIRLGSGRAPQDQGKALASASTLNRLELGKAFVLTDVVRLDSHQCASAL